MTFLIRLIAALALTTIWSCASTTDGAKADGGDGDGDGDGDGNPAPEGPACFARELYAEIATAGVDSVDLLFVVDNSASMRDEQASLSAQFPRLIAMLTSGDLNDDGVVDFPPVQSLHLGVASTDLGLPGIDGIPNCQGLGDEGRLLNAASPDVAGCSAETYNPPFLTFDSERGDDAERIATDLACIATLGVDGCAFEQPLESALKAVWPGADQAVTFVTDTSGFGMFGNAGPGFPNGDFIRNDPNQDPSLVAIVLVTDEEDCSSRRMDHFVPGASPNGLNTRCFFEGLRGAESNLFQVNRYIEVFKLLRPGREDLVIFAGIVGVPQRLTTPDVTSGYDFNMPGQPEAYFDMLLGAAEMQEMVDDRGTPDVLDDDAIRPSCDRGPDARAMPPRRIVQVAKGFGANGIIQSICQENFGPAIDVIVETIAGKLGAPCLPNSIPRSGEGVIDCEVTWELPRRPVGSAPTTCDALPFLTELGRVGPTGGEICDVAQVRVDDGAAEPGEEGWYYDDFSVTTQQSCTGASKQRIAFTSDAQPPAGVTVALHCFHATYYTGDNVRTDLVPGRPGFEQPEIGSPCDMVTRNNQLLTGDEACVQRLVTGDEDTSLFCHPSTKACALRCSGDEDCPNQWFCDDRAQTVNEAGRPVCSPGVCSAGATSTETVGDPCLTLFVPENGFDDAVAYVEGNHPYCDGGACIVYHLEGDPRQECVERGGCVPGSSGCNDDVLVCADSGDVEARVYCSCRCDAPEGFAECDCPDGFSCVDVLENGPAEISGGYCVRNGSVVSQ
jgi:hypothetical protein